MIDAFYLLDTGYCRVSEASLIRGGRRRTRVDCHSLVALLHHTREGWLLFDTGYNGSHLAAATSRLPYRLYRWLLPAQSRPEQSVVFQLNRFGLTASDISWVIVSHFHPDHTGGLSDFPNASLVCDRQGWEAVRNRRGWDALRRGFLPDLIPADFADRACLIGSDDSPTCCNLGATHDLFGDGALLLIPLPGHARGQIGLFAPDTPRGPVFLVADAAYVTRSLRGNIPPHPITNVFADDGRAVQETISRLHTFCQQHPDVILLPTHCPESFARVAEWSGPG